MVTNGEMSRDEKINRIMYRGLYNNSKTNLKVVIGFTYLNVFSEVFKFINDDDLVARLISTMGISFFAGTLFYYHKTTPNQLIKFVERSTDKDDKDYTKSGIQDDQDEDNQEEEEEEEEEDFETYDEETENNLTSDTLKPTFNYFKLYQFAGYALMGGFIGNTIGSAYLVAKYGPGVALEWNSDYIFEILLYNFGSTVHNVVLFGIIDSAMKAKWFLRDKKKLLKYNQ